MDKKKYKIYDISELPKLLHLSADKINVNKKFIDKEQYIHLKPRCMWYSYKLQWTRFSNTFRYNYEIKFKDDKLYLPKKLYLYKVSFLSKPIRINYFLNELHEPKYDHILVMTKLQEIIEFTKIFSIRKKEIKEGETNWNFIDYPRLTKLCGGFLILRYKKIRNQLKELINKDNEKLIYFLWFFSLDISGGCIWNHDIYKLTLL